MWRWSAREIVLCFKTDYSKSLSKSADHETDFQQSIKGGGRFRELEYRCIGIVWAIIWDPNKVIDIEEWPI